mmetsp:Transcript_32094/g.52038  ORF Transcript_32094/g.52038 Transcript_32094/m.52038 type:complete len:455 (-) Transcript_32094:1325-2689(-)
MNRYHHEQISKHTYKIVENDPYGQYPFLYAIMGVDKCVVIDTGTGIGDFAGYVDANINKEPRLPYLVINTHVHFDHVGGNHKFAARKGFRGVHMSGADKRFSLNLDINSLCMAHNCTVKHYKVDKWLKEGDTIYLDDSKQERGTSLEIIETPGHTPDSIAIYSHLEKLLFVGDNIYPYTVIHLDCIGSNVKSYVDTLKKLQAYIIKVEKDEPGKLRSPEEVEKSLLCQPCDDEEEEKGNGDAEAKIDSSSSTGEVESKEEQSNEKDDEENHRKDAIANKEEKNDDRNSNETNNKQCATKGENKNSKSAHDEDDTRSCIDNSQAESSINNKNKKENKSSEIIAGQKGKEGGVSSNSNNKQRDQQEEKSKGPPAAASVLQEQHPHQKLIDDFCQLVRVVVDHTFGILQPSSHIVFSSSHDLHIFVIVIFIIIIIIIIIIITENVIYYYRQDRMWKH